MTHWVKKFNKWIKLIIIPHTRIPTRPHLARPHPHLGNTVDPLLDPQFDVCELLLHEAVLSIGVDGGDLAVLALVLPHNELPDGGEATDAHTRQGHQVAEDVPVPVIPVGMRAATGM